MFTWGWYFHLCLEVHCYSATDVEMEKVDDHEHDELEYDSAVNASDFVPVYSIDNRTRVEILDEI